MYRKVTEHFGLLLKVENPPVFVRLAFSQEKQFDDIKYNM